ncbi:MAG: polysaccharide deacetylase family protein [Bacillota bacterium]|nr:polysaccharide deacetylase family protein [Bacillota bacterium]MDW7730031.1 polysaccharide deacetylase family protein [Bacillota bacterium]
MIIDIFVRGLIFMIFISGSTVISYYATRLLAFLIPSTFISDIFLWSGTVLFSALLLMGVTYYYVYRGFGTQADIIRRVPEPGNRVAITFDDGPSEKYTPRILDILKEKNAKATFFMVGMQVEKNPELVRRIVEEGHDAGNHTYGHITVPNSPPPRLAAQIMRTNLAILQHSGVYPQFLRPPRGLYDMRMRRLAGLFGQNLILWSLSSQDWHPRATPAGIARRVLEKASAGDIILFHDSGSLLGKEGANRQPTVDALGPVIDGLRAKGLEIAGLEETIIPKVV